MASHANFEIDIISALSIQLVEAFSRLETADLSTEALGTLPSGQGVYKLYHQGSLVYVGKTENNLKKRLDEHRRKILGRQNIKLGEMGFRCLFIHRNWTALAPENALIRHYRAVGEGDCAWNGNGFGAHDPGRNRETTNKPPDGFDAQYPIRDDLRCEIKAGAFNGAELLQAMKRELPYLLRYQMDELSSRTTTS